MVKKGIYLMKSTELGNAVQNEFEAALNNEDNAELAKLMASKYNEIAKSIEAKFEELKDEHDEKVLASRGIRTLTSDEEKFYNRIFSNEVGNNPSRGTIEIMPKTIFDQVFDDLRVIEPNNLLSLIDLQNTTGAQEWMVSIAESPVGAWGEITGAITAEISAGFKVFNTNVNKFSCYIPWAKSVIDLGAVWQDAYVRALLTLAIKNGLTIAACSGDGINKPFGMAYDFNVDTKQGTKKTAVEITKFDRANFGKLFATLSKNPIEGETRAVQDQTLIVDSETYYSYIYPNESTMTMAGVEVNQLDNLGVKLCICPTGLDKGQALLAMPKRYAMQVAAKTGGANGMIEFSDDYLFLDDKRVYKTKVFANGFLKDVNGAILLDVTKLTPVIPKVQQVTEI